MGMYLKTTDKHTLSLSLYLFSVQSACVQWKNLINKQH